jgi:Zn-dependent peptidase ImmA (M78 family)
MPTDEIVPMLKPLSLDKLSQLKLYWKVSMQAIVWNAELLGCIKPSTAGYYRAKLNARGWLQQEPYDEQMICEKPTLLDEIMATHRRELEYSEEELARLLLILPETTASIPAEFGHLRVVK